MVSALSSADRGAAFPLPTTGNTVPISQRILDALRSGHLSAHKKELARDFKQISTDELLTVLTTYFEEAVTQIEGKNLTTVAEELSKLIPFEKLETAVFGDQEVAFEKAKSLLHQAQYHLENSQTSISISLKSIFLRIIDTVITFIESVLSAFGVADFFKPASTKFQQESNFHKIMMLLTFFTMVSSLLIPVIGAAVAGPIIGGVLLLIGAISIIWPKIAPAPSHLPCETENWTKRCLQGEFDSLSFAKGRKAIIDEIASTLVHKKHPLIQGESRIGKNETVKAFVQALERGDYPELKGKQVFYLNAASLCQKGDFCEGKDPILQISEAMGRHRDNIILVIDEIHTPFMDSKFATISQKLKSKLDVGGDFPLVIGITTLDDLSKKIGDDTAFINRFHPITITSTNSEVTQEILVRSVLRRKEPVLCEANALEMIVQKTTGRPQPHSAQLVLRKCVELTSEKQQSPTAKKLQELRSKREFFASKGVLAPLTLDVKDQISTLDKEITALRNELKREKDSFSHLFRRKESISKVKAHVYRTVLKIVSLSRQNPAQLNTFMLMSRFLVPALDIDVRKEAERLKVNLVINEAVIDRAMTALGFTQKGEPLPQLSESAPSPVHGEERQ